MYNNLRNYFYLLFLCSICFKVFAKHDGLEHQIIEKNGHSIHIVMVDPSIYKIISVRANNDLAKEEVSAFTKKFGADAGINGGFFYFNKEGKANPSGVLKIEDQWYGFARKPKDAIGWDNNEVLVDRIVTKKNKDEKIEVTPLLDSSPTTKKKWQQFPYIVGGLPILIKNGSPMNHSTQKGLKPFFLEKRHARTAVCIKDNNQWVLLVGSHTKENDRPYANQVVEGLTIDELTQILQEMGCKQAINLDGGGSTTLVIDNKVVNSPAGDMDDILHLFHERSVSDAILVVKR